MQKTIVAAAVMLSVTTAAQAKTGEGRANAWRSAAQGAPSLKAARKAVELHPNDAVANNDLGWAYRQNGDLANAEKYLREAIKLNDQLGQAHSNLSVVLLDKGSVDEAQTEAARAVAIDGSNPIYKVVLGNAFAKKGERKAAIEQYQQAIKLKPDYENALYNLGRVLSEDGQTQEAKAVLADALKLDSKDERVLQLLDNLTKDGD